MMKYFHFHNLRTSENFDGELKSEQCQHLINDVQCRKRCLIGLSICWLHLLLQHNLRIKTSTIPNAGLGLFAIKTNTPDDDRQIVFRIGDQICPYNGQILTLNQHLDRYAQEAAPYSVKLYRKNGIQMYEDASLQRGIGSLVNHSCRKDNCRMSGRRDNTVVMVATKNIKNHSEILVNYGNEYRLNVRHTRSATNNRRLSL